MSWCQELVNCLTATETPILWLGQCGISNQFTKNQKNENIYKWILLWIACHSWILRPLADLFFKFSFGKFWMFCRVLNLNTCRLELHDYLAQLFIMHVSLCDLRDIFEAAQCNVVLPVTLKFKTVCSKDRLSCFVNSLNNASNKHVGLKKDKIIIRSNNRTHAPIQCVCQSSPVFRWAGHTVCNYDNHRHHNYLQSC